MKGARHASLSRLHDLHRQLLFLDLPDLDVISLSLCLYQRSDLNYMSDAI